MNTFITWLNTTGPAFCEHAFWMLVQTAILFGVLWMLDRMLHKSVKASFRYALWLLILVNLLLPVDLALPSGIGYWFHLPQEKSTVVTEYLPAFEPPEAPATNKPVPDTMQNKPQSTIPSPTAPARPTSVPISRVTPATLQPLVKPTLMGVLFGLWLLCTVCLGGALLYQIWYVRRIRLRGRAVPESVLALLRDCQSQLGLKQAIGIKQSDEMPSPAVCGLLKPTVLIPSSLVAQLDADKLRSVLLHELGHIHRKDLWINMFQTILQLFYFYNPFVRLGNHWIRRTREQANDEHVLCHLDGRRQDYSATLLEIASAALARPALAMRMIGVAEPKTQLHERITLIMKKPLPKNSRTGALGIAALVIAALLLLPMAAGPRLLAEESLPQVKPLSKQQTLEQEKQIVDTQMEAFNGNDLENFMSVYTDDVISLPDQAVPAVGTTAMQMLYRNQVGDGTKILEYDYVSRDMWSCGEYMVVASQNKITVQIPSMTYLRTMLRNYLMVYQAQPDGTMKVKMEAWNNGQMPSDPQAMQAAERPAESKFHAIQTEPITASALNEQIEKVKQMDIEFHECFNRQDLVGAGKYYADDAILMSVDQNPIRGIDAIKTFIVEGSQGAEHIANNQQIIHAEGNESMVIIVNQFGWVFRILETNETQTIPGKGLHVWIKQPDGSWKIQLDIHNTNIQMGGW